LGKFRNFIPCCLNNWALWRIPEKCFLGCLKKFQQFGHFYSAHEFRAHYIVLENFQFGSKFWELEKIWENVFQDAQKKFRQFWIFRMPINKGYKNHCYPKNLGTLKIIMVEFFGQVGIFLSAR
jgi:hypothetical protein